MSGRHEVDCAGCGRRHAASAEQARAQRVVRCSCGQFVRLDHGLAEVRSDPAPPPPVVIRNADDDDERTHLLDSLSAVAALSHGLRARAPEPSLSGAEPAPRPRTPSSAPHASAPGHSKPSSTPPGSDKPLWYVDLGGLETVEMTIEQLIIARRSGKLGEGALVWREGMPRWRPVGTLIPAASRPTSSPPAPSPAQASRPTPSPVPRSESRPPPPPPRAPLRTPSEMPALSFERPVATLEFALESPGSAAPREPHRPPLPSIGHSAARASQALRAPSSIPPAPRSFSSPGAPAPRIEPALAAQAAPPPRAIAIATPLTFNSDEPSPTTAGRGWLNHRPRWVSAGVALVVCASASSAGAFVVRSLLHRPAPALTPTVVASPLPHPTAHGAVTPAAQPAAATRPLVVALESLSVERRPLRTAPRPPKPAIVSLDEVTEASAQPADDSLVAPTPGPDKQKSRIVPAAAASDTETSQAADPAPKQSVDSGSDEPGL